MDPAVWGSMLGVLNLALATSRMRPGRGIRSAPGVIDAELGIVISPTQLQLPKCR
ncbi:MAG TPA: hypothetical protein VMR89_05980 [Actinomycetota bacterium]|nr:hypothetical protein [Actinomycetota bacterium]